MRRRRLVKTFPEQRLCGWAEHSTEPTEASTLCPQRTRIGTTWKTLLVDLQADKFGIAVRGIARNVARVSVVVMLPGHAPFYRRC